MPLFPGNPPLAAALALLLASAAAAAQELEPRSYSNTPVGLNFVIAGVVHARGQIAFDPSTRITDANFDSDTTVLAYARSFDAWGKSAKFDVILPYTSFSGEGLVNGQPRTREMNGLQDPQLRVSVNFLGAPALSLREFAGYRQDLIVGASLLVSAPLGQYDNTRLLNLGSKRWSMKAELGLSKAIGPWTFEVIPGLRIYTDNTDFNRGNRFAQAPVASVQGHAIYNFPTGQWLAIDTTYFTGARTTLNGAKSDNEQENWRLGLTLALPLDRYNSVKLYANGDVASRTGSGFDSVGIAWQHRWGEGY